MWFGHLFKVFRSVSLDLTGYVASYGPLKANININCRCDSFELDTLFFFGKVMHISHFQCPVV